MKKETQVDIYVCLTIFHVYVALLNILNKKNKSLLILTDNIVDVENLKDIISKYITSIDVITIDNLKSKSLIVSNFKNRLLYFNFLNKYYSWFVSKYDNLLRKNTINIFNDTEYFNMFLLRRYSNFNLLEDGVWMHPVLKKDIKYFIKYFILKQPIKFGHSNKIKRIIVQDLSRLPNELLNKGEVYSLESLQNNLSNDDIATLKRIFFASFDTKALVLDKPKMIILTQPISEEDYISEKEKIDTYKNIINHYNKNNKYEVFIKNHPRDKTEYFTYINNINIIPCYIPFELFSLEPNISFDIGITLWSSSIYNVKFIKEKIFLGTDYIKDISKRKDF